MPHTRIIEHWLQELRFAIRQLVRYRGYGAAAVIVPALGIAASVALFGFVDAAMIRPLPYGEPSRLFTIFGTTPDIAAGRSRGHVSYLDFQDWRERTRTLSSIAAYDVRAGFTVTTAAGPERVAGLRISGGFFRTLSVTPLMGRDLAPEDERSSTSPAVLISYGAWQRRFGGSPDVLGKTVTLQFRGLPDRLRPPRIPARTSRSINRRSRDQALAVDASAFGRHPIRDPRDPAGCAHW